MPKEREVSTKKAVFRFSSLIFILTINVIFLNFSTFRGFNFFDMGGFLDASWRVYRGQIPYNDFIYTTGPVHLYLNAFFFHLFGFGKTAVLAHLITVSSIVIFAVYSVSSHLKNNFIRILVTLLSATSFYWPLSHPWYDQSAHLWGILGIAVLANYSWQNKPNMGIAKSAFISGVLAALSFLSKSNVGLAYGLFFFVFWLFEKSAKSVYFYLLSGLLSIGALFFLTGSSFFSYFDQAFTNFGFAQNSFFQINRITYLLAPASWFRGYYWIIVTVVLWVYAKYLNKLSKEFILLFGTIFVALFSMLTSSVLKEANMPLAGASCAIGFLLLEKGNIYLTNQNQFWRRDKAFLITLIVTFVFIFQSILYGFELKPWTYAGTPFGDYQIKSKPLQGWWAYHEDGEDFDQMVEFINQNVEKNESLLVLTDMQILYAAAGKNSYRGVPFMFSEGDLPAPGRQLEAVRSNIVNNPSDWIVTHRAKRSFVTFIVQYLKLRDFVVENYEPAWSGNNYAILKKKGAQK